MVEPAPLVSVTLVTFNSARVLPACLESLRQQDYRPLEVLVVDNASSDATRRILQEQASQPIAGAAPQILLNEENRGFAAAQNQAIRAAWGEWILCLNPDVILQPDFIGRLIGAGSEDEKIGSLCGKLRRWEPAAADSRSNILDSTGMYFLRNLRHLDRGAEQIDHGQYEKVEYVVGASGAAALYRRAMIEDVSIQGEFFDEDFFAYREDADLAWRAQLLGWRCLYLPTALGWHERRVTPERRERLPHEINWHSVKNRFLMRIKNIGFGLWWRTILAASARDALIFGYALVRNWRLFSALFFPLRNLRRTLVKRRIIQTRRRVSDARLAEWFQLTSKAAHQNPQGQ